MMRFGFCDLEWGFVGLGFWVLEFRSFGVLGFWDFGVWGFGIWWILWEDVKFC